MTVDNIVSNLDSFVGQTVTCANLIEICISNLISIFKTYFPEMEIVTNDIGQSADENFPESNIAYYDAFIRQLQTLYRFSKNNK